FDRGVWMRGGVTGRQSYRQGEVIARLKRATAFGAVVDKNQGRGIGHEKWPCCESQRPRSIGQGSTWWCCCEAEHCQQASHRTKQENCESTRVESAGFGTKILFHSQLRIVARQKMAACRRTFCLAFPVSESLSVLSEKASDSSTGPKITRRPTRLALNAG